MRVKTSELTGAALDWAVAKCEGKDSDLEFHAGNFWYGRVTSGFTEWRPSTDWRQSGPIIEREGLSTKYLSIAGVLLAWVAKARPTIQNVKPKGLYGPTLLIAAMRCYVASKLGDEVEVPDYLF